MLIELLGEHEVPAVLGRSPPELAQVLIEWLCESFDNDAPVDGLMSFSSARELRRFRATRGDGGAAGSRGRVARSAGTAQPRGGAADDQRMMTNAWCYIVRWWCRP